MYMHIYIMYATVPEGGPALGSRTCATDVFAAGRAKRALIPPAVRRERSFDPERKKEGWED